MELLFISHKYPPTIGGMEKQCFELIAQAAQSHKVHKLVHDTSQESKLTFFRKLKNRVKAILQKHPGIQIIHLNDGLMGLFTLWLKNYTKIPVVITFHGLDLVFPNRLYQSIIANKYTRYDAAICVSTATARECVNRNFAAEKVFTVPNGVDHQIAEYRSKQSDFVRVFNKKNNIDISNKKVIAMLGRPVQRKGFSWFLKTVLPQLAEDVLVIIVGPVSTAGKTPTWKKLLPKALLGQIELAQGGRSDEHKIRELLKDPKLKGRIIQTGKLPFSEVLEILSVAKLFVMPNIKKAGDAEGFGLVALEASLRKTVVLASDLEGIPEAIQDNRNGYLLPSKNKDAWIEKITALLNDPQRLTQNGTAFQQFTLQNYSWEKMTAGYIEVFENILNRHKSLVEI